MSISIDQEVNKPLKDDDKVKVPDPSIVEDEEPLAEKTLEENAENKESMIEGAWADILGSGQLKKKVVLHKRYKTFTITL